MWQFFVYLEAALMITMIVHEYGHYRAFRKNGIRLAEAGLGFPVKQLPKPLLAFEWKGVRWTIQPLFFLGAYVRKHTEDFQAFLKRASEEGERGERRTTNQLYEISAAGIKYNFYLAAVIASLLIVLKPAVLTAPLPLTAPIYATVMLAVLARFSGSRFSRLIVPVLGVLSCLGMLYLGLFRQDLFGGPIEAGARFGPKIAELMSPELFLIYVGLMSMFLGVGNCMPLSSLDGGKIAIFLMCENEAIPDGVITFFEKAGSFILVILMLLPFILDGLFVARHLK